MKNVALITLHGMGETPPDYAGEILKPLRKKMGSLLDAVDVRPVYYQEEMQANQREIWTRIDEHSKVHYDALRKFLLFGFGDAAGLESRKDDDASVYELAQVDIARALLQARRANHKDTQVVFLTHSLGGQVLSNYLYDAQKKRRGGTVSAGVWKDPDHTLRNISGPGGLTPDEKNFLRGDNCIGWISTGCNIPIFVAACKEMHIRPIDPPRNGFKWLNLYDPDDVLGWPLQPLSAGYRALVEDRAINSGNGAINFILKSWNPSAHSSYWTDDDVVDPLARMLGQLLG
ncbi:hypothetical protein [Massilia glaciei]|uniref:Alpha/beta hydrolase n=1 Tax=Massilia glaciei TaxID=1524097 RepID=A0A2U2HMQ6_9BURK|nr:hypothetical protein [Massilia glaciei]PWF48798.1 hypothetical protein C7C56_010005 [Massilia glaciei]